MNDEKTIIAFHNCALRDSCPFSNKEYKERAEKAEEKLAEIAAYVKDECIRDVTPDIVWLHIEYIISK